MADKVLPAVAKNYVILRGLPWPPMVTEEALDAIKKLPIRDDDILVATFPKAGTNWLSEICRLVVTDGDMDLACKIHLCHPLEFVHYQGAQAEPSADDRPLYRRVSDWPSPRVLHTHVPIQHLPEEVLTQGKGRVITSVRNPKDSAVSEFHFLNKVRPGAPLSFADSLEENFFTGKGPYGSWFDHVLGYWDRRHEKNQLVLKYEDMKMNTRRAIVQIAGFLGRSLSDDVIDKILALVTVDSMRARFYSSGEEVGNKKAGPLHLLRKGVVGDWKTVFTVAQNETLDKLYRDKMSGSGLTFDFE
ncbi:sulfotransferase 1A1-like [Acanthaster planci]|uniref:Sulfotransferase 1A1-like n=1 Tax=Acanthaster planci TaxID=133434 RepID=A0A8B7ZBX7_ACAPL|nr:sulfotransferase 1A1-like [Acanthaster planci]XP_022100722.1 sulfotransferase 1A1-like [Acanthaster planci]